MTAACRPLNIALEGPCCAGKTTLGHYLLNKFQNIDVTYVRDYSDYVGGGRFLPPPIPSSLTEEELSLNKFLDIEAARTQHINPLSLDLILIDRSVHTLIAHCYGLKRKTGVDYAALAERTLLTSSIPLWPDLVIYLDTPTWVARLRNKGKFPSNSIFIDSNFNSGIKAYFLELAGIGSPSVIWLDAKLDPHMILLIASNHVQSYLNYRRDKHHI